MLRLRLLHARANREADFVEPDPRREMADLARAFPGALREIDELAIDVIRARIDELTAAEQQASRTAPWMDAHVRFHRLARGALATKRWLEGRPLTPELHAAFAEATRAMSAAEREEAGAWADDLAAVAKPPRGRLMDLVYARLADELATDIKTARAAVFPPRRSGRRA